jgi:prepilin-type N-terminal cleavage/methylation domain-containing protein
MNTDKHRYGFTLLETLVAVTLLGLVIAAIAAGFSGSLRNIGRSEDYQRAVLLARAQMHELLALPEWKDGQSWSAQWNRDYRWTAKVERVPEQAGAPPRNRDLMRLVLIARWKSKSLTLETARMQPKKRE